MPNIPLKPEDLPQQRIYSIDPLPDKPDSQITLVEYGDSPPFIAKKMNKNARYLCQVEWSWSPMHSRISAYHLTRGRQFWVLWESSFDENDNPGGWSDYPVAFIPLKAVSEEQASVYLLMERWQFEQTDYALECFHWINESECLTVSEIKAISMVVWPEQ